MAPPLRLVDRYQMLHLPFILRRITNLAPRLPNTLEHPL